MKKIIFFLTIISTINSFSQKKEEIRAVFWGNSDKYSKVTEIPEKWKNESAVMILKSEFYDYHKYGKSVTYVSSFRKRVKLQDAAAVKEFSEFSFKSKSKTYSYYANNDTQVFIGVKIIKPSGKEIEIDVEKETKTVDNDSKLAISNLEVGDIIDYYFYNNKEFKSKYEYGFDQVETTLSDVYPIMDFKLEFQTENDFFVNFNTYNGAPELKEIPSTERNDRKYELNAKNLEKNEFPRWFFPLAELPCYKFQVFFARSGKFESRADAFLSKDEKLIKKSVTKEDIFDYYNEKFVPFGDVSLEKKFLKDKSYASDEERIREVYYFARHEFYTQFIEPQIINKANIYSAFFYQSFGTFFSSEQEFINHFMQFLKKINIDYDIVVATERENGSIDDLLIQRNLRILLRVNTPKPMYLEYFSPFTSAEQFNFNLENTKAYVLQVSKGKRIVDSESITLPSTTVKDNVSSIVSKMILNEDFSGLKVTRNSSFFGHFKEAQQADKLNFYDYLNEDYDKYGKQHCLDLVANKKDKARFKTEFEALVAKSKEEQKEGFKKSISEEFDFEIDNNNFVVKNTGRFGNKSPFEFQEDFEIKNNLIKKAGDNYLVELGKMITAQVAIDKKEQDRKNNVYLNFPKSFWNEIILEIPKGYEVSGLDKFNKSVVNETGEFVSSAIIKDNKVVVKTSKIYNTYYEPNKNWAKMVQFLDAAYQFTQEKILLKKI